MCEPNLSSSFGADLEPEADECIAVLEFENGSVEKILKIPIYTGTELRIGRDSECSYSITDLRVSKQHFRIYSIIYDKKDRPDDPPLIYCEDLESSNGTYVNDILIGIIGHERVGCLLSNGDVVAIRPKWKFRFHQTTRQSKCLNAIQSDELQHIQDRYVVSDRVLGNGVYGTVYLAQDQLTLKQVACKIVDFKLAIQRLSSSRYSSITLPIGATRADHEREAQRRMLEEIGILSKLSHPNIINLQKAFCSDNALYIFTDLAAGGDLFSYLQSFGGRLDDYRSRVITRQVTLAVKFIHSKGIAHRDIKPENVLVTHTDFGSRVLLTDFGLATYATVKAGRMVSKVGTEGYVAPEIEAVSNASLGYTMAADLWSLGIMTMCLLTGTTLIPKGQISQLSQAQISASFFRIDDSYEREQWLGISPRARSFLRKLLVIYPEQRMSAGEALNHSWYKQPAIEAAALEEGYQRVIRFWKPRKSSNDMIEDIPFKDMPMTSDGVVARPQKKVPDTSLSPYFNLERHLHKRTPSKRKRIIADLNESGSHFMTCEVPKNANSRQNISTQGPRTTSRIISVEGRNLFRASNKADFERRSEDSLDEVVLVPTTPLCRRENGFRPDDSVYPISSQFKSDFNYTGDLRVSGEPEIEECLDVEDRRIHDLAAKELPRYGSAKALKDAVMKMKETT